MENDSAPLHSTDAFSQSGSKVVTRHIDNAHADGMILASQSPPPPMHNVPEMDVMMADRLDVEEGIKKGPTPEMLLGPDNTITVCQYCRASVRTSVRYTTTTRTHITAALFYLMCCRCCIPYCVNSTKNCDHYCPNCAKYLGTYKK